MVSDLIWRACGPQELVLLKCVDWLCLCPRIELRALGKISPGEEVTVSYVDYLNLSEDRRRLLKQQYFFDCTCEHCTNRTKDDLKMAGAEVDGEKVK